MILVLLCSKTESQSRRKESLAWILQHRERDPWYSCSLIQDSCSRPCWIGPKSTFFLLLFAYTCWVKHAPFFSIATNHFRVWYIEVKGAGDEYLHKHRRLPYREALHVRGVSVISDCGFCFSYMCKHSSMFKLCAKKCASHSLILRAVVSSWSWISS